MTAAQTGYKVLQSAFYDICTNWLQSAPETLSGQKMSQWKNLIADPSTGSINTLDILYSQYNPSSSSFIKM